jgi:hypothetical protein
MCGDYVAAHIPKKNFGQVIIRTTFDIISVNHGFDKRANFGKVKLRNQTETKEAQENDTPI